MMMPRPKMPTDGDQRRSLHQADRLAVLDERHGEIAMDWMKGYIAAEILDTWGPPDLSVNPLAEHSLQLATPGLYGVEPTIHNADDGAVDVREALSEAACWSLMQRVEYYARGLGDMLVRLDHAPTVDKGKRLTVRLVWPHNVWVDVDPADPMRPVRLGELRVYHNAKTDQREYCWEVFDISEPDDPKYGIYKAGNGGALEEDVTSLYAPEVTGYPWKYDTGEAFIPHTAYHAQWTGTFWNYSLNRGMYHGTLNSIAYATFTGHAAHSASGTSVVCAGLVPIITDVQRTDTSGPSIATAVIQPGAMLYHETDGQGQPMVTEVGPGANLEALAAFTQGYTNQQAIRAGLSPANAQRASASPSSGASLYITNKDKREASARIEATFRRSDLELLRKAAALLRIEDIAPNAPEAGWSIAYHHPPESPQEEKEKRERIDWLRDKGFLSSVQALQKLQPGMTREAAIAHLQQVRADEIEVSGPAPTTPTTTPEPTDG